MARPTDCTPETIAKVCEALALGVSWAAAAAHAGVDESTLTRWRQRGESGEEPFHTFCIEATRARDSGETRMASIVLQAAEEGNATAAMWWLERRRSAEWGRKDRTENVHELREAPESNVGKLLAKLAGSGDGQ